VLYLWDWLGAVVACNAGGSEVRWLTKKAIDYAGRSVNGFLVVCRDEQHDRKAKVAHWKIRCNLCGLEKVVQSTAIRKKLVGKCVCQRLACRANLDIANLTKQRQKVLEKLLAIDTAIEKLKATAEAGE
jgi:transcription elongation factor Elf1